MEIQGIKFRGYKRDPDCAGIYQNVIGFLSTSVSD